MMITTMTILVRGGREGSGGGPTDCEVRSETPHGKKKKEDRSWLERTVVVFAAVIVVVMMISRE